MNLNTTHFFSDDNNFISFLIAKYDEKDELNSIKYSYKNHSSLQSHYLKKGGVGTASSYI